MKITTETEQALAKTIAYQMIHDSLRCYTSVINAGFDRIGTVVWNSRFQFVDGECRVPFRVEAPDTDDLDAPSVPDLFKGYATLCFEIDERGYAHAKVQMPTQFSTNIGYTAYMFRAAE